MSQTSGMSDREQEQTYEDISPEHLAYKVVVPGFTLEPAKRNDEPYRKLVIAKVIADAADRVDPSAFGEFLQKNMKLSSAYDDAKGTCTMWYNVSWSHLRWSRGLPVCGPPRPAPPSTPAPCPPRPRRSRAE